MRVSLERGRGPWLYSKLWWCGSWPEKCQQYEMLRLDMTKPIHEEFWAFRLLQKIYQRIFGEICRTIPCHIDECKLLKKWAHASGFRRVEDEVHKRTIIAIPELRGAVHRWYRGIVDSGWGILFQKRKDCKLHPVQFSSRTMNGTERSYSVCEIQTLTVIFALKKFRV